jgi:hypothetical protein
MKGFDVLTCPCANTEAAVAQLEQVYLLRKDAARTDFAKPLAFRMKGVLETSWMSSTSFIHGYYRQPDDDRAAALAVKNADTLKVLFAQIRKTAAAPTPRAN